MRIRNSIAAMTIGCCCCCMASLAGAADDLPIPSPGDAPTQSSWPEQMRPHCVPIVFNGMLHFELSAAADAEKGAYLGVATSPPAQAVRQQLKLSQGTGLNVDFVEPGSPAANAGLKQYDVITKIDDQIMVDAHQLAVLVRMHKPDDEVALSVIREGKTETLKAKLVERDLPPLEMLGNPNNDYLNPFAPATPYGVPPGARLAPTGPGQQRFQLRVFPGAKAVSTTTWADGEHTLTVTAGVDGKQKKLVATDRNGTVLFDGPIDTPEDRAKVPTIVSDKLKKLEAAAATLPSLKEKPAVEKDAQPEKGAGETHDAPGGTDGQVKS